ARHLKSFAYGFSHPAGQFMRREMDMRVTKTFFLRHNQIIGAWFPKNKRLDRNAPHADFGITDHDSCLESGFANYNVLGDNLQKHMSLFEHERFHIERSVSEQALRGLSDLGIVVCHVFGRKKRANPLALAANEKRSALKPLQIMVCDHDLHFVRQSSKVTNENVELLAKLAHYQIGKRPYIVPELSNLQFFHQPSLVPFILIVLNDFFCD